MKHVVILSAEAQEDVELRDALATHLAVRTRSGELDLWHEGLLVPGEPVAVLDQRAAGADALVVLLTPDLLADERRMALADSARARGAPILPVIARACDWPASSLASLTVLPSNHASIATFKDPGVVWNEVAAALTAALGVATPPAVSRPRKWLVVGVIAAVGGALVVLGTVRYLGHRPPSPPGPAMWAVGDAGVPPGDAEAAPGGDAAVVSAGAVAFGAGRGAGPLSPQMGCPEIVSARFLDSRRGRLLEVVADNRGLEVVPLTGVTLSGRPTQGYGCGHSTQPPVTQDVTINWRRELSTGAGFRLYEAWTKFEGQDVGVRLRSSFPHCGGGEIQMDVPLQLDLAPDTVGRIVLRIWEQGQPKVEFSEQGEPKTVNGLPFSVFVRLGSGAWQWALSFQTGASQCDAVKVTSEPSP